MKTRLFLVIALLTGLLQVNAQMKDPIDDNRRIRIPVVFHIIYTQEKENISDSLILRELQDVNLDFSVSNDMSMLDQDFRPLIGNPNIEFYLLDSVLQAGGSKGIDRFSATSPQNNNPHLINPRLCLNVFIADQGNASDILSDRVNLNYIDVGSHGHALTHETGHWLGLYHIWGKIGNCNKLKLLFGDHDDDIEDTPEQWGCTDVKYRPCPPPTKLTYKGHKIMYNNFMDYNACRCMFSIKQAIKMRNNIIVSKRELF